MRKVLTLGLLLACTHCGSDGLDAGGADPATKQDFLSRCNTAYGVSCDKGFACDNFFYKSTFNSADHCKSENARALQQMSESNSTASLRDCAQMCDTMKSDLSKARCDQLSDMTFNEYRCGQ